MWRKGCHCNAPVSGPVPCPTGYCDVFSGSKAVNGRGYKGVVAACDGVAKCFAAGALFAIVNSELRYSDVVAVN